MEFARSGDRGRFEKPYFGRRDRLGGLALAECIEGRGRFLDEIVNGLQLVCEETTWCLPAHAERNGTDPLARADRHTVDLFAAETAMILAECCWLLAPELERVSPSVVQRVRDAIRVRVVEPVELRDDVRWFSGFNNWTPWCASNVLGAALYTIDDTRRLAALTHRLLGPMDRFVARYGADGGCDEGPHYWNHAAGAMLVFFELLGERTGGAVDVWGEPKIVAMGRYFVSMHLHHEWFVNFADCTAKVPFVRPIVYRYGERIGDAKLQQIALLGRQGWVLDSGTPAALGGRGGHTAAHPLYALRELFWMPPEPATVPLQHDTSVWLPDVQVFVARECEDSSKGLVLAVKGGHNGESHNHNDIGHFTVMLDGEPRVIDIGVESYTAKTFGPNRYDIWCIRASAHNAPVVNGVEQAPGEQYRATNARYSGSGSRQALSMDLHTAYPEIAGLASLKRELTLDMSSTPRIRVKDTFTMRAGAGTLSVALFFPVEAKLAASGELRVRGAKRDLVCRYPADALDAVMDTVVLEDKQLRAAWGPTLWRCTLSLHAPAHEGHYELTFSA
jgi:hypothetical protein